MSLMSTGSKGKVLITGATGFVGRHLCQFLLEKGWKVRAVGRLEQWNGSPNVEYRRVDSIDGQTNWKDHLKDVEVVIHLAARVHQMHERGMEELGRYQEVNVRGTRQLAQAAMEHNVKRFIYLSSIKVNGEKTMGIPFRAEDQPRPEGAYSLSKLQGELILQEVCRRSGMEWVIIRPVLVYGAGVGGNVRRLLNLANGVFPLPLGSINNRRSWVNIYNLCDFIACCVTHPNAHGEVFLVSDDQDISTPQWIRAMRRAHARAGCVFPFPVWCLQLAAALLFRSTVMARLTQSLQVNIEKSKRLLGWRPPLDVDSALKRLAEEEKNLVN